MHERLSVDQNPLFEFREGQVQLFRDDHSAGPVYTADWSESALARVMSAQDNRRLNRFVNFMRSIVVCRLHPPAFITEVDGESSTLSVDGANFGAWYRSLLMEHPHLAVGFYQALGDVIDGLHTIRLVPVGIETRALAVTFIDADRSFDLYLGELSDGQRAIIALYGLLYLARGSGAIAVRSPQEYLANNSMKLSELVARGWER